ncbi:MAG: hypothetical protein IJF57_05555 [Clostridia bacterium]|nr:hypothetical protein [Clostridia bacterium]
MKKAIIAIIVVAVVAAAATGAYFLFFKNSKPPVEDIKVTVTMDDFIESHSRYDAMMKNPERYMRALAEEYQMGTEGAEKFFENAEEWLAYEQIIVIKNDGDHDITVYGYEIEDNGKNGIYISTSAGGEIGIPPGGTATTVFSILCSDIEASTDEAKALVDEMNVNVVFTKSPEEYENGTESVEETKTAAISKAIE